MKSRLLSHIALKFAKHPENVANESLCFILNADMQAPKKLLAAIKRQDLADSIISFRSELSTEDNGRPDVAGVGADGRLPLIVEGKFWASLTDNQPTNYLKELDANGVLIFACPESRTSCLKDELEERTQLEFEYVDTAFFRAAHNDQTLVIIDWLSILSIIDEYASLNNTVLSNDIHQLKALCSQMDGEGFHPLSQSDLNEHHGRLCDQLSATIDLARERLRSREYCDFSGVKASAWRLGYGFFVKLHAFGCQVYFSTKGWYSYETKTPYWIGVQSSDWKPDKSILDRFNTIEKYSGRVHFDGSQVHIAIPMKTGLDQEQLTEHIAAEVDGVSAVLGEMSEERLSRFVETHPEEYCSVTQKGTDATTSC